MTQLLLEDLSDRFKLKLTSPYGGPERYYALRQAFFEPLVNILVIALKDIKMSDTPVKTELLRRNRITLGCRMYGIYTLGLAADDMQRIDEDVCMDNLGVPHYVEDLTAVQLELLQQVHGPAFNVTKAVKLSLVSSMIKDRIAEVGADEFFKAAPSESAQQAEALMQRYDDLITLRGLRKPEDVTEAIKEVRTALINLASIGIDAHPEGNDIAAVALQNTVNK